jgi:hypothetical protein
MTFFDQYSYKQKNYALVIVSVLLLAASYKRAFKTTIETKAYRQELITKLDGAKYAVSAIRTTQKEIAYLNKLLGKEDITIEKVQQGFLNFVQLNSSTISVNQIDEVLTYQHPDFAINTHRIVVKGNYISTLKFIYALETKFDLAKLVHVHFEFKKYSSEEKEQLYTTLLMQNYER